MTGFLAELGKKLAERWVALLLVPGLLYVATVTAAVVLGQQRWADVDYLSMRLTELSSVGGSRAVLAAVVVLLASAAAGLLAQALRGPVAEFVTGGWPFFLRRLQRRLTERRKKNWDRLQARYQERFDATGEAPATWEAAARRNRYALAPPERPTWIGDRLRAPAVRVREQYGLDAATSWSRLWLLLPEGTRETLSAGRERFDTAALLSAWSMLYLLLGLRWWPAAIIGVGVGIVAWRRARVAAEVYGDLIEATFDVHTVDLMQHFARISDEVPSGRHRGLELTERFRKST